MAIDNWSLELKVFGQKDIIVIWVSAKGLTVLGGKIIIPEQILFPPNIVSNLEVVDPDALYALVKDWTVKHPATGSEIVWIFGQDVCYEHVMQEGEKETWDSIVLRFLDLLPFEEVESRVFASLASTRVVAINKNFYDSLKRGFALQGYITRGEISATELGKAGESLAVDKQVYAYVLKNLDILMRHRLAGEESAPDSFTPQAETKKKNSSLPILIGVFSLLLIILAVMFLRMNK